MAKPLTLTSSIASQDHRGTDTDIRAQTPVLSPLKLELIVEVMRFLNTADRLTCRLVSWQFARLAGDNSLWKQISGRAPIKCADRSSEVNLLNAHIDRQLISMRNASGVCAVQTLSKNTDKQAMPAGVKLIAISADGARIASASFDKTVMIWDLKPDGAYHSKPSKTQDDCVNALTLSPNGRLLYINSENFSGKIKVYDLETGSCLNGFANTEYFSRPAGSIASSPDGEQLAAAFEDNTVRIWDFNEKKWIRNSFAHRGAVTSFAFSADSMLLVSGSMDHMCCVFQRNYRDTHFALKGHEDAVTSVSISDDRQWIASGSWDRTVRVWNSNTGACVYTLQGHDTAICSVVFSPDSRVIFSASYDGMIRAWDAVKGVCLYTLQSNGPKISSLVMSADGGRIFAANYNGTIKVWDFRAKEKAVLKEIAALFRQATPESEQEAMERFNRMPQKEKTAVYAELGKICGLDPNDNMQCAMDAFHDRNGKTATSVEKMEAIENYLRRGS